MSPSADSQEEARLHQEQAFPQEGQETHQEIFIERPPASVTTNRGALWTGERNKSYVKTQNFQQKQAAKVNPPIKMNKEHQRFSRPPSSRASSPWRSRLEMLPSPRKPEIALTWRVGPRRRWTGDAGSSETFPTLVLTWGTVTFDSHFFLYLNVLVSDRRQREQERLVVLGLGLLYALHHPDRNNTTHHCCTMSYIQS